MVKRVINLLIFLFRGVIGGALGGFFFIIINWFFVLPKHRVTFVDVVRHIVPLTAIIGLITGGIIWLAHFLSRRNLGIALTTIFSVLITAALYGLFLWNLAQLVEDTLLSAVLYLTFFGVIVGTTIGIVINSQVLFKSDGNYR